LYFCGHGRNQRIYGRRVLKQKLKGFSRETMVHNFETAQSAVILFDASTPNAFPAIKEFREYLEESGVKCTVYGYVPEKEVPQEMLFWKNFYFLTRSDLNWYLKPSGETADSFFQPGSGHPHRLQPWLFSWNCSSSCSDPRPGLRLGATRNKKMTTTS
jgi:hypothetical protein